VIAHGWIEVYAVVEGALGESFPFEGIDAAARADAKADELLHDFAKAFNGTGSEWAIYVLPHSCDRTGDEECVCATWLTDHAPVYSSSEVSA
jgi:hypothetical protein